MGGRLATSATLLFLCLAAPRIAAADDGGLNPTPFRGSSFDGLGSEGEKTSLSYLWDGGAIPFIWAPLAVRLALDQMQPRTTPWMFGAGEGGAAKASWEIPGWGITALGGALALGMIGSGDDSRMYHVKGLAQAISTGVMLTAGLKLAFGRHRPDWDPDVDNPGSRRSFPSGHSTQAFAIATYTALFLRRHVFDSRRGDRTLPWWEAATYGGLFAGASLLGAERVLHDRHHLTDVVAGAALGTAASSLFFMYQEGRYNDHKERNAESVRPLSIAPTLSASGAGMSMSFSW